MPISSAHSLFKSLTMPKILMRCPGMSVVVVTRTGWPDSECVRPGGFDGCGRLERNEPLIAFLSRRAEDY